MQSRYDTRISRLPPEPNLGDPHVVISVRHIFLGVVSRIFKETSLMQDVYSWIGSLQLEPDCFALCSSPNQPILPSVEVNKINSILNMECSDDPIDTPDFDSYPDIETYFASTANTRTSNNDDVILDIEDSFLSEKRTKLLESFTTDDHIHYTSRQDVLDSFKKIYSEKDSNFTQIIPKLMFVNELAVGDGVTKEAFSQFFNEFSKLLEGNEAKVPTHFSDDDLLVVFGIFHAYILFGMFPVFLAEAFTVQMITDKVQDEILVESFLKHLHFKEGKIISEALKNHFEPMIVSDILSDFGLNVLPTERNVKQFIIEASKTAFIRKPFFWMSFIKNGMGNFWHGICSEDIHSLYTSAIPNAVSFLNFCDVEEENTKDGKCTTWFNRYIRCCTVEELKTLLRFVTGSSQILPQMRIKVRWENTIGENMRPRTATCFKLLYLSRNHTSFSKFSDNINVYINSEYSWEMKG